MALNQQLYIALASLIQRKQTLGEKPQFEDSTRDMLLHVEDELERLVNAYLPSGGGFDAGTAILLEECETDKLVFQTGFHHMNSEGYYEGWTHHKVVVTPSFTGFTVRVGGKDKNMIKDYITESFYDCLSTHIEYNSIPRKAA